MAQLRLPPARLPLVLLAALCAVPSLLTAQEPAFSHERAVPQPIEPAPFPATSARQEPVYTVELRSADELTEQDRLLVANSESSIAEHAGFAGLAYGGQSNWSYRQIVCPSFPNHLFLAYMRNGGAGDTTMFSASIPRNGVGRIRIVPILRRGYSLFSPAPINALTISAFNHIRAEEGDSTNSDWLGNALCYAALAGSAAHIRPTDAEPAVGRPIVALTAAMEIEMQPHGTELLRFDDSAARPHPTEWTMTFTRNGKLIKATHRPASLMTAQVVPQKSAVVSTRPVQ
jgi:hypothetical protein